MQLAIKLTSCVCHGFYYDWVEKRQPRGTNSDLWSRNMLERGILLTYSDLLRVYQLIDLSDLS